MKRFPKLAIISLFAAFSTNPVFANIYRVDFHYSADTGAGAAGGAFDGVQGSLTGYMILDLSLDTGNARNDDSQGFKNLGASNSWITDVSLTFDPDDNLGTNNSVTKTRSDLAYVLWNLSGGDNSFNVNNNFATMFTEFGFESNPGDRHFAAGGTVQNYVRLGAGNEFPLNSTTTTPGGLPFLGLGALFYYYRKLKNKTFKN